MWRLTVRHPDEARGKTRGSEAVSSEGVETVLREPQDAPESRAWLPWGRPAAPLLLFCSLRDLHGESGASGTDGRAEIELEHGVRGGGSLLRSD